MLKPAVEVDEKMEKRPGTKLGNELELVAQFMDSAFQVPGSRLRFGFDAIVGLIPFFGDLVTSLVSVFLLSAARRHGVSRVTMARMASNVAIDFVLGAVPVVGDAFDFFWKANERNVALLRKHATARTPADLRRLTIADGLFVGLLALGLVALLVGCGVIAYWLVSAIWGLIFPVVPQVAHIWFA